MAQGLITYKEHHNSNREVVDVKVYLEKRLAGKIKRSKQGWVYFPKDYRASPDVFPTLERAKKSLEGE